jgi:undecaprenyl-diphosphatase
MTTDRARLLATALKSVVLPIALLTAGMIGLGLLVTHVLVHVWPFTIEGQALTAFLAVRTPTWNRVSDQVSQLGYAWYIAAVWVVVGGTMRVVYHRWRETLFLAAAVLGQLVVYLLTSRTITRARPPVPWLDSFDPVRSFFSGHVSAAVALYGGIAVVLAMHARRSGLAVAWWVLLLIVPVAVAISRMYRGMHYPSDVTAGFLVGLGCLWIMRRAILTPVEQRGSGEP